MFYETLQHCAVVYALVGLVLGLTAIIKDPDMKDTEGWPWWGRVLGFCLAYTVVLGMFTVLWLPGLISGRLKV